MSKDWLRRFVVRTDPVYDNYCAQYQATTFGSQAFYLFMHLAPGIFAYCLFNIDAIYFTTRDLTGMDDRLYQYMWFIFVTYAWHIAFPFAVLHWYDGLSWPETFQFLGLNRIDWKGLLVVLPLLFVPYTLLSIPYFYGLIGPIETWLGSIPAFAIPEHSIFGGDLYTFPATMLLFLFIGNFLGEELYYRGYLMKKCAFLGRHTWWITAGLFAIYHFWQIPQTWPLIIPALVFGLVMVWRKDLYVLIALHALLNLVWIPLMYIFFVPENPV